MALLPVAPVPVATKFTDESASGVSTFWLTWFQNLRRRVNLVDGSSGGGGGGTGSATEYIQVMTTVGVAFTLPSTPAPNTLVLVWRSGLKLSGPAGDYTISGATITFANAYLPGDAIDVVYTPSSTA